MLTSSLSPFKRKVIQNKWVFLLLWRDENTLLAKAYSNVRATTTTLPNKNNQTLYIVSQDYYQKFSLLVIESKFNPLGYRASP